MKFGGPAALKSFSYVGHDRDGSAPDLIPQSKIFGEAALRR
jgi:hypothetical protein